MESTGFGLNWSAAIPRFACLIVIDSGDFWHRYGGQAGDRVDIPAIEWGGAPLSANWYSGNAAEDGQARRGWILGHFIDPARGIRSTRDAEVKWGIHPAGEKRPEWTAGDQRTTLAILIEGDFRVDLTEATVNLARQGDYVMRGPGIDHSREALSDSIVLTVRWPSPSS